MPTLFNLFFYNVVHNWLYVMLEGKLIAHYGVGLSLGRCMGVFYADDGLVMSRDPEWLQRSLNVLICLF